MFNVYIPPLVSVANGAGDTVTGPIAIGSGTPLSLVHVRCGVSDLLGIMCMF